VTGSSAGADRPSDPPTRLERRLGVRDAVIVGLGSMIGAGVFTALGPAAEAAGSGIVAALILAGAVAFANATSSAQLAARYPESGGTYVYGRKQLGPYWGFLAGWGFVVGKTASCAAMALTLGAYVAPGHERTVAVAGIVAVTLVNLRGIAKTAAATRAVLAIVLAALAVSVVAGFAGADGTARTDGPLGGHGVVGVLQAAGLLFFAFAGYARIATLGEEVRDPRRTIVRAIPLALGITLAVYALVITSALVGIGPDAIARATAPLEAVASHGPWPALAPLVRVGAAAGSLSVLLSLTVGVSRTGFAMAQRHELPRWLGAVHPRSRVPHHAEVAVAMVATLVVVIVDVRGAIGFSSFAVLVYYAIANASAWTLPPHDRRWPRWMGAAGLGGCLVLAAFLPLRSSLAGTALLALGSLVWWARLRPEPAA
jgi:APA family basic amino acid/polyamine antiporter